MKKALIVQGGWAGHEPVLVAERFRILLEKEGFEVEVSDTLDIFLETEKIRALHLIIPIWTMGSITSEQLTPIVEAVASGTGLAGCHGGMCDAFRESTEWQFMTGGQWVAHPGGGDVEYTVNIIAGSSSIVDGIADFSVKSEQYYMHIDPAVEVLATTGITALNGYHVSNGPVDMPQIWTKKWGQGRVFYSALGHNNALFDQPPVLEIMRRGFLWAVEGKDMVQVNESNSA